MKKLILLTLILVSSPTVSSAHEEPAKTLSEKKAKEKDRKEILSKRISSYTVMKHSIANGSITTHQERYLVTEYDKNGNIYSMSVYKSGDSLDYKIIFTYDQNNNMITDTDYDPLGKISENIKFTYDDAGRVKEQYNYTKDNEFDSRFTYEIDNKNLTLLFTKFKPQDKIEYHIIYKYLKSVDQGNNVEIIKQDPGGKLIMRVENVFDDKDSRTHKKIFDENNRLMYYFEYSYDKKTKKFGTILRKSPDDRVLSSTIYTYNSNGLTESVKTLNESGQITSFLTYKYNKY
ncbi:MAG: hypothetical protein ACOXZV_14240 [Bacteroidales bacterium]